MDLTETAGKIRLLLMDCDGVLTDGRLYFSVNGEALKVFDARDGQGISLWHAAGFISGIITGRDSEPLIRTRFDELQMRYLRAASGDKVADLLEIMSDAGVYHENVAYIGDDVGDIEVMKKVGFPVAVADAAAEAKKAAAYVTESHGGRGAVREVIDMLLANKT